ncbi:MAG: peptidase dimerization domain-containing protein, partial [Firmicutes bacterium]|nr:peptidase dimerization domain-containing protein [Bacillota bacterium]
IRTAKYFLIVANRGFLPAEAGEPAALHPLGLLLLRNEVPNLQYPRQLFAICCRAVTLGIISGGDTVLAADDFDVIITGEAAHAATNPRDGISAIQVAAEAIRGFSFGRIDDQTTANIGVISGGVATNIVAEQVSFICLTGMKTSNGLHQPPARIKI